MSTSVKITPEQVEKINDLIKDKDLNYRSRNDFVVKAVEHEIRHATLKRQYSPAGKYHFEILCNVKLDEAIKEAIHYDYEGNAREEWIKKKLKEEKDKKK